MANIERLMSPQEIADLYGGTWSSHPRYPVAGWQRRVVKDQTRLGYWQWVLSQIEQAHELS